MSKSSIVTVFLVTAGLFIAGAAVGKVAAAQKEFRAQTVCPVMGDPINRKYYADYRGSRVYFCCSSCPDEFKKDPEKYMKKLRETGVSPEKSPAGEKDSKPRGK